MKPTISKSQYVRGLQCNKALWLSHNRKDLQLEPSAAKKDILDTGNTIGKLAMDNYPAGVEVTNEYWDINGAIKLQISILKMEKILFLKQLLCTQ